MKKVVSIMLVFALLLSLCGCGVSSNTVENVKDKVSKTANEVADAAKDGYNSASDYVEKQIDKAKEAVAELSLVDFQSGFETAASFFGSTVASLGGQTYVNNVAQAISNLEKNVANRVSSGKIASVAGNLAEEWHSGTFNIDAIARDVKSRASTGKSNELGSADVSLNDGTDASLKYYKTAKDSAQQQAKNYIERYREYASGNADALSMDEWLASNGVNLAVDDPELYWSIYKDQVRIIPKDQLDDAIACLEKSVKLNAAKEPKERQYVSDTDLETLKNLTDRLKSNGTESVPLTKAEAEAIAKAAQRGEFTAEEFGITLKSSISGTYIAKQAIKSGATSAIIEAAMVLGPEIYEIIKYGIENGKFDIEQIKTAGVDGLNAAADGFLKGSISNALVIMCQAGKLGAEFINASPEIIGALTVFVVDAVKYGIMLADGKITTADYIDLLAEELVVSAGSLGAAALAGLLFPSASLAIMLGSFVGGLVISAGYTTGKTYVLALIDSSEIDLLVPIEETADAIKGLTATASVKIKDAIAALKNLGSETVENVTLKVYDLKAYFE